MNNKLADSEAIRNARELSVPKQLVLGLQHLFTMFGSAILVPLTTGLDVATCLLFTGIGTLLFHFITKRKVPIYHGASYAYITPILMVAAMYEADGLAYARGGILVAGIITIVMSQIVRKIGINRISKLFPPVITGTMILVIGLNLAGTAVSMAGTMWWVAIIATIVVIICNIFGKGFIKTIPVVIALIIGYIAAAVTGNVDFSSVQEAAWIGIPQFGLPKFSVSAICLVAPVCIAVIVEHFGDIAAIGGVVGEDFYQEPGVHRTLLGDGIATSISALGGGCALTTYSENTGVLALTKVYDPLVMRIAAVFAIILSFCPKLAALVRTIPDPVIGGITIILFGFVAGTGLRTLHSVNFTNTRNQILFAVLAILSLGGAALGFTVGNISISLAGMPLGALVAIILNLILPHSEGELFEDEAEVKESTENN